MVDYDPMIETATMRTTEAIAARVRARARLLAAWTERLWSEGQTSHDQGLAITPGEVRRILMEPEEAAAHRQRFLSDESSSELAAAVDQADALLMADSFWDRFSNIFGLSPMESDLLCLLVATEMEPQLGRVLAYVSDDTRATQPTLQVAAAMFGWEPGEPVLLPSLLRWRLAHPLNGEPAWQAKTGWQLDRAVRLSVAAEAWADPALDRVTRMIRPDEARQKPCVYPGLLLDMLRMASEDGVPVQSELPETTLIGPDGSGRETLAAAYAAERGRPLLVVKTATLVGLAAPGREFATPLDALIAAARLAHATNAVLYLRDADDVAPADWAELLELAPWSLRGTKTAPATTPTTRQITLKPLPTAQRLDVWSYYSDEEPPAVVRTQRLTPAEVKLTAEAAPLGEMAVQAALRRAVPHGGQLLHALKCPYTWDDLVVSADLRRTLKDFESQIRLRWEVYEDWGFQRLTHLGQGISALFGGPSGTGKTMAAQVLARSLGLELYRVDLAGVVNKYIGETEKRLRDVFDACERSGALLFFDEADALFGSRMQVKDSHDRFANIEIDYLLQRIEQFDGIAILATNRKNDLDSAFLRRLRFVIDFLAPGEAERRMLWEKALLQRSPDGEQILDEIDFALLAREMDLNGAQIKGIALGAAFLARSEGARIGMRHIEVSAHREYAKQGLRVRTSLGNTGAGREVLS